MADRLFTVVHKAPSAAKLWPEDTYQVTYNDQSSSGSFQLRVRTRWEAVGLAEPLPRDLWDRGRRPRSIARRSPPALPGFARPVGLVVAFVTNATVGLLDTELAFESTPNLDSREFAQAFTPGERGLPRFSRLVDVKRLKETHEALLAPNERRLYRALGKSQKFKLSDREERTVVGA
jgi:hypothetical protein